MVGPREFERLMSKKSPINRVRMARMNFELSRTGLEDVAAAGSDVACVPSLDSRFIPRFSGHYIRPLNMVQPLSILIPRDGNLRQLHQRSVL